MNTYQPNLDPVFLQLIFVSKEIINFSFNKQLMTLLDLVMVKIDCLNLCYIPEMSLTEQLIYKILK